MSDKEKVFQAIKDIMHGNIQMKDLSQKMQDKVYKEILTKEAYEKRKNKTTSLDKEILKDADRVKAKRLEVLKDLFPIGKDVKYYINEIDFPCVISDVSIDVEYLNGYIILTPKSSVDDEIKIEL